MNSDSPRHEMSNDEFDAECNKLSNSLTHFFSDPKNNVHKEVGQCVLINLVASAFCVEGYTQFQAINAFTTVVKQVYAREDRKNGR